MSNDDQNWLDLLTGRSVPDAEPNMVRDVQIFRGALLAHADKLENDSEMPYPELWAKIAKEIPPPIPFWKRNLQKIKRGFQEMRVFWKRHIQKIKRSFPKIQPITFLPPKMAWAIPAAVCVLVVSVITCIIICPQEDLIDTTYQTIYANKTDEMAEQLREFQFRWEGEGENVFGFEPAKQPSTAAKAFAAGLLTGREALLGKSEVALPPLLLPPATEKTWLETSWVDHFKLGRWTVLLWTASQFHRDLPPTFWDEQRQIFSQLKAAFVARVEKGKNDNEAKKVLSQLEKRIEPHLENLPMENNPKFYKDLGFNLKKMMHFLAPKPESKL
jgi:hypothetical protein